MPTRRNQRRRTTKPEPVEDASLEDQRRLQLLNATTACIAEVGIGKTTMRLVADRAGVTTGMVLYYFKNKKDLIDAAINTALGEVKDGIDSVSHSTYGRDRLKVILRATLTDVPEGYSRKVMLQLRKEALTDEDARRTYLAQLDDARARIARSIRTAQDQGELRADVPELVATDLIYCLMEGLATEEALSPEYFAPDRAMDISLTLLELLSEQRSAGVAEDVTPALRRLEKTGGERKPEGTAELVGAILRADPNLSREVAEELSSVFRSMYSMSIRVRDEA